MEFRRRPYDRRAVAASSRRVLGAALAETGTESLYSPSGFTEIAGLPDQTWYHWGEAWLGAAVISICGMEPLHARHFVVLPLMLLGHRHKPGLS